ncbi:acetyl-CoA carboxylase [Pavlovales sp. CCMP2436]|nr:acetyl-CoA carboxylase [Pavlovales sp. CCMP2436]
MHDKLRRGFYPTLHHYLELGRLENFSVERLFSKGDNVQCPIVPPSSGLQGKDNVQVFLGTEKPVAGAAIKKAKAAPNLYVRLTAYDKDQVIFIFQYLVETAPRLLQQALDDVELARLDGRVAATSSARIFLHVVPSFDSPAELLVNNFEKVASNWLISIPTVSPTPGTGEEAAAVETIKLSISQYAHIVMRTTLAAYAPRLLKLSIDEIEVKIHCNIEGQSKRQLLLMVLGVRLMATSLEGSWLRTNG